MMLERQVAARSGRLTCQGRCNLEIKEGLKDREDKSVYSQPLRLGSW